MPKLKFSHLFVLWTIIFNSGDLFTQNEKIFNRADTLRGSNTPERAWWDILHYDLDVIPDFDSKTISGKNTITYTALQNSMGTMMQIDMNEPLRMDSIVLNELYTLSYTREGNVFHVQIPDQKKSSVHKISLFSQEHQKNLKERLGMPAGHGPKTHSVVRG